MFIATYVNDVNGFKLRDFATRFCYRLTALMSEPFLFTLPNELATQQLAAALASALPAPAVIYLHGNLGAGKTFFTRSFLSALGFNGRVKSPTFTLMEPYAISSNDMVKNVYHFDFYRFTAGSDWRDAGFEDYLPGNGIAIVEWPENATGLPTPDLDLCLAHGEEETMRFATLHAHSEKARKAASSLGKLGATT
jgi:tRNA threonylcarbamoyladenosine biosynthesis protein TsaE